MNLIIFYFFHLRSFNSLLEFDWIIGTYSFTVFTTKTYSSTAASAAAVITFASAFTFAFIYRFMIMMRIQDYFEDSVAGTFDHASAFD